MSYYTCVKIQWHLQKVLDINDVCKKNADQQQARESTLLVLTLHLSALNRGLLDAHEMHHTLISSCLDIQSIEVNR
jgi:hypothetical protein